jgi:hypothetical protein
MKCMNCDEEIPDTAKVCGFCGTKQIEPVPVAPTTDAKSQGETVSSPARLDRTPTQTPAAQPVRKQLPVWAYVFIGGGVIAVVAFIALIATGALSFAGNQSVASDPAPAAQQEVAATEVSKAEPQEPAAPGFLKAVGRWESIDEADNSYQTLEITDLGGGRFRVVYRDQGASACGTNDAGEPLFEASIEWEAKTSDNELTGSAAVVCATDPPSELGTYEVGMEYRPGDDALLSEGVVWTRSN